LRITEGLASRATAQMSPPRPRSATHWGVALSGLVGFAVAFDFLYVVRPFANPVYSALLLMPVLAAFLFAADFIWGKLHRRPTTGLDFSRWRPSWRRSVVKLVGLVGVIGFIAALYALFPEYYGDFYAAYFYALGLTLPILFALAVPYVYWVDAVMTAPEDGLWQAGSVILLQFGRVNFAALWQHLLGWLIKGFFLPLMFVYFCRDLGAVLMQSGSITSDFKTFYDYCFTFLYFIDVCYSTTGYVFSLRLFDTHLRSSEPTLLGWSVALMCYEPFWSLIGGHYLAYDTDHPWGDFMGWNQALYTAWGSIILALILVYVWATVMFGCRFSNLTHRGIITNGPYRFTKHPAYIAKNLTWWMISLPFLADGGLEALRHSILLLMLNGVYAMRAWTEERHLSRDPTYVAYRDWMAKNGLFRFLNVFQRGKTALAEI
jgi:hypothetical protein